MSKPLLRIMLVLLLVAAPVAAGPEASPQNAAKPPLVTRYDLETGIGETVLQNGLRVITQERHTAPIVTSQMWFRVGSAYERSGETGLAHFLEHMFFKGTKRYGKGEIDLLTLKLGGSNNAATSRDYTMYYFNFASDRWQKALDIQADWMRNLRLDQQDFDTEKKVVIEELQMGRDDPWGEMDETVEAAAYLVHPYRHPIIGWRSDVERVTREQMKAFYDLHYHPRNAILVIVGDFDTRNTLAKVSEFFGALPPGPERGPLPAPEPPQNGTRRVAIDRDVSVARMQMLYHSVRYGERDARVLEVIAKILASGKASRLERRLVEKDELASSITAMSETRRDPGLFWLWTEAREDVDPDRLVSVISEELELLVEEDVAEEDLARVKTSMVSEHVFSQAVAEDWAYSLGYFATLADWRLAARITGDWESVTAEDIRRVAGKVFRPENLTVVVAPVAGGGKDGGAPGRPGRRAPRRSAAAAPPGGPAVRIDKKTVRYENGLTLHYARHSAIPVTAINLWMDSGILREAKPGLANFTSEYLMEGAGGRDGAALAAEIDALGASIRSETTGMVARCLSRDTGDLVRILGDILRRPDFPEEALEKLRGRILNGIRSRRDDPAALAGLEFMKLVYGDHPRARATEGTEESVSSMTREEVLDHFRTRRIPKGAVVAVVSDRPFEEIEPFFREALADWEMEGRAFPAMPAIPPLIEKRLHIEKDTDQANILIGHVGVRKNDPDFYPLLVMDFILGRGPGFTDRLSKNIRDRDGLAYDVGASITATAGMEPGMFRASVGTSASQAKRAANAIVAEIRRIREEPVTAEELADAKAYLTGSFVFGYETAEQLAAALLRMQIYGLGFDYPEKHAGRVAAVTMEDVLRVAKKHLHPDKLVTVIVGP